MRNPTSFEVYAIQRVTIMDHLLGRGQRTCVIRYSPPTKLMPVEKCVAMDETVATVEYAFTLHIEEVFEDNGERQHVYLKVTDSTGEIMEKRPVRHSELTYLTNHANRG